MREQELARQKVKSRTIRIGLLVAAAIVAVFVLVIIAGNVVDDDSTDSLVGSDHVTVLDAANVALA